MTHSIKHLAPKISRHYSSEQLHTLLFLLEIDYDELPGDTKTRKVTELLSYISRQGDVEQLLNQLEKDRPKVAWRVGPPADRPNPYKGLRPFWLKMRPTSSAGLKRLPSSLIR